MAYTVYNLSYKGKIFYIGVTGKEPSERLINHFKASFDAIRPTLKDKFIKQKALSEGLGSIQINEMLNYNSKIEAFRAETLLIREYSKKLEGDLKNIKSRDKPKTKHGNWDNLKDFKVPTAKEINKMTEGRNWEEEIIKSLI